MLGETVGHYRVLEEIGRGAMSTVYRADDLANNRAVAIKLLSEKYTRDREAVARFDREGRASMAFHHPHICAVYGTGNWQGRPFLVMELLEGTTLAARMKTGLIRPHCVAAIGLPVLNALEAAHTLGVIHRDIKPANIFLTRGGQVKVLDFGLAKTEMGFGKPNRPLDTDATVITFLTMPGTILGTVAYMPPEQVRGERLDGRADLYSFGVVLFEALTGRLPLQGAKSPLAEPLASFVGRLIHVDRNLRFAGAAEARAALLAIQPQLS